MKVGSALRDYSEDSNVRWIVRPTRTQERFHSVFCGAATLHRKDYQAIYLFRFLIPTQRDSRLPQN